METMPTVLETFILLGDQYVGYMWVGGIYGFLLLTDSFNEITKNELNIGFFFEMFKTVNCKI